MVVPSCTFISFSKQKKITIHLSWKENQYDGTVLKRNNPKEKFMLKFSQESHPNLKALSFIFSQGCELSWGMSLTQDLKWNCWRKFWILQSAMYRCFRGRCVTTKTTPKRSTYGQKNHQCLHLRLSGLDSIRTLSPVAFSWFCQLQLPQQVALTEFNSQVNARVRVIVVTRREVWNCFLLIQQ